MSRVLSALHSFAAFHGLVAGVAFVVGIYAGCFLSGLAFGLGFIR